MSDAMANLDRRKALSDVLWDTEQRLKACQERTEQLLEQLRQSDRQQREKQALTIQNAALLERVTVLEKALESVRDAASGPWAEPSETARRVIAEIAQKALDA